MVGSVYYVVIFHPGNISAPPDGGTFSADMEDGRKRGMNNIVDTGTYWHR